MNDNDKDSIWACDCIAALNIVASDDYPYKPDSKDLAQAISARDFKIEELEQQRKSLEKFLEKFHPYTLSMFPTTIKEASELLKNKGLTDREMTAISGTIARIGYDACLYNIKKILED